VNEVNERTTDMEHEPIRVGQVRQLSRSTPRYTITAIDDINARATLTMDDTHSTSWEFHYVHEDPVVGWSREHLPPPVLTANPAEVVEGEVRYDGELYRVHSFCDDGSPNLTWLDIPDEPTLGHPLKEINGDRLVSRPGVTL
jgi:hypothetical protein